MKIVVCVKQVPDTKGGVKFNPDGTLDRAAMLTIMNPDDKAGLEAALRLKDQYGAEVTVLTMGLPKAEEVLREAMAMGADKGILVTDRVEGDSVIVERQFDDRYHVLKAKMPCLITALAELNEPRYMTPGGIFDAYKADITVWGRADLKDVENSNLGLKGSPTQIAKASDKVRKGAGEKVNLDPAASVDYIVEKLKAKHVI